MELCGHDQCSNIAAFNFGSCPPALCGEHKLVGMVVTRSPASPQCFPSIAVANSEDEDVSEHFSQVKNLSKLFQNRKPKNWVKINKFCIGSTDLEPLHNKTNIPKCVEDLKHEELFVP
jgi:hypothetical protein